MCRLMLFPFLLIATLRAGWPGAPIALGLGLSLAGLSYSRFKLRGALYLLGASLPLMPLIGHEVSLVVALAFLTFYASDSQSVRPSIAWAGPFVISLACAGLSMAAASADLAELQALGISEAVPFTSLVKLSLWASSAAPVWLLSLEALARWLMFFYLISFFWQSQDSRRSFQSGLLLGLLFALLISSLQLFSPKAALFINQNAYWDSLHRLTGTFSDPNAFGIFAVLTLPLVLSGIAVRSGAGKWLSVVVFALLLVVAPFSGSRSYFAGIFFYVIFVAFSHKRIYVYSAVTAFAVAVALINFWHLNAPESYASVLLSLPTGVTRVVETLDFETARAALFSRLVFSKISWAVFNDHPFFGIGLSTYRNYVPEYARVLQLGTGAWTDNPNNFYLGILAELGFFGAVALILTILNLRLNSSSTKTERASVYCLGLLLLLGPHLEFNEISILAAVLIGSALTPRKSSFPLRSIGLTSLFGLIAAIHYYHQERGMYAWEPNMDGSLARWTERSAQFVLRCDAEQSARLRLQFMHPGLGGGAVTAKIESPYDQQQVLTLTVPQVVPLRFKCVPEGGHVSEPNRAGEILVRLNLDRAFVPEQYNMGADRRILGARELRN